MLSNLYVKQFRVVGEIPETNYISGLSVVRHLQRKPLTFNKPVTFFIGENGIGKSTLIEGLAVALGFNPEGGSKNFRFSTENSHSDLHEYLKIVKGYSYPSDGYFLRAESFYNVATNIDELDRTPSFSGPIIDSYGGVSLHKQSHGESFMSLVENRFGGKGLYILDEPEAALSPMRLLRLLCNINELVKDDSQFIISTHSPILMAFPGAEIYEISEEGISSVAYEDTEHYRVTKQFLDDHERMIHYLFR